MKHKVRGGGGGNKFICYRLQLYDEEDFTIPCATCKQIACDLSIFEVICCEIS
jgi:hypothetical protein